MQLMLAAARAVLFQLDPRGGVPAVLLGDVIAILALGAGQCHLQAHIFLRHVTSTSLVWIYSYTLVMTPAPTVKPPSRIAKRLPASKATGMISFTVMFTLSPGITISTPAGNV